MFNLAKMMKDAQKMQERLQTVQAEIQSKTVTASLANGAVRVTVNGTGDVLELKVSKEIVDPEDLDMLQDLLLGAIQQAQAQAKQEAAAAMKDATGGMGLPPGLGF
jgi:nucleoid-associated protein EbfC